MTILFSNFVPLLPPPRTVVKGDYVFQLIRTPSSFRLVCEFITISVQVKKQQQLQSYRTFTVLVIVL
jgi:hypothetical protein